MQLQVDPVAYRSYDANHGPLLDAHGPNLRNASASVHAAVVLSLVCTREMVASRASQAVRQWTLDIVFVCVWSHGLLVSVDAICRFTR